MRVPPSSFCPAVKASIHEKEVEIRGEARVLHLSSKGGGRGSTSVEEDEGMAAEVRGLRYELSSVYSRVGDVMEVAGRSAEVSSGLEKSAHGDSQIPTEGHIDVRHDSRCCWRLASGRERNEELLGASESMSALSLRRSPPPAALLTTSSRERKRFRLHSKSKQPGLGGRERTQDGPHHCPSSANPHRRGPCIVADRGR